MFLVLAIIAALVILIAFLYNRLVRDRNRVDAAWSDIDVQLQRRYDLIPQIVKAVNQYAKYERATLEAITALRTEAMRITDLADIERRSETEEQLGKEVHRLLAGRRRIICNSPAVFTMDRSAITTLVWKRCRTTSSQPGSDSPSEGSSRRHPMTWQTCRSSNWAQ
jgi:hypothetical protein